RPRHARPRGGERVAGRNRETTTDEAGTVGFAALAAGGGRAAERDFRDAAAYRVVSCVADGTATATGRRYAMAGRAKRLPRAVREQQMLDAAIAVLAEGGYQGASMDAIARQAEISKPMLYL